MVGTNWKPSFSMFKGLTKEEVLNAPSVPIERLKKECEPIDAALKEIYKQHFAEEARKNG